MYAVIRLLATCVTNNTYVSRVTRRSARQMLEGIGVVPPSTLGKSRDRKEST